ncbi:GerMN domain-containing protein [Baaleninema sp.]|uniref:GerMN domain-containing protein n=1 Tax=Baaleninema sp. TaxID=3101197 RepID=UPI003D03CAE2
MKPLIPLASAVSIAAIAVGLPGDTTAETLRSQRNVQQSSQANNAIVAALPDIPPEGSIEYDRYTNPRFNYELQYPENLLSPQDPPENADGRLFSSRNGNIVLSVWGSHNISDRSIAELYQAELEGEPRNITYQEQGDDWFVISGYEGDDLVFYTKKILVPGNAPNVENIVTLNFTYDRTLQPEFDAVVAQVSNSLEVLDSQPGDEDYPVSAFFPDSSQQAFDAVEPVTRISETSGVARFAIEELIDGPTPNERERGLYSPISFEGSSTCEYGQDFKISVNDGDARLQFCRDLDLGGVGDTAPLMAAVERALRQFSTVSEVTVLNQNGNCVADYRGTNECLRD